ncbi:PQQ-binding-like beta-propeller repeat protein [Streptomyces sp. NPDC053474]|uniref:outer membrane protein assembly factor BamB family protein n=1 Tax=Streptomyces sp. NPDC053474 TaxID=3365704 RepID=UPI0037CF0F0B
MRAHPVHRAPGRRLAVGTATHDWPTGTTRCASESCWWATASSGSSPAVAGGVVYVGSDDDNLYAVDAATGKKRWTFPTGHSVGSSPAVADGVVYFGSNDNNLYAVQT